MAQEKAVLRPADRLIEERRRFQEGVHPDMFADIMRIVKTRRWSNFNKAADAVTEAYRLRTGKHERDFWKDASPAQAKAMRNIIANFSLQEMSLVGAMLPTNMKARALGDPPKRRKGLFDDYLDILRRILAGEHKLG